MLGSDDGEKLDRRSQAAGWGITSNLAHPGVAPTNLLAARPEVGRARDTVGVRVIRALSRRGILLGTVETALLPALLAATSPDARGARLYGPSGLGHLSGAPAEQAVYSRLRGGDDAERIWQLSENLTHTSFPADERAPLTLGRCCLVTAGFSCVCAKGTSLGSILWHPAQ